MRVIKTADNLSLYKKAANFIASCVTVKPNSVLALTANSKTKGTYEQLINRHISDEVDFLGVKTVMVYEHTQSQKAYTDLKEQLLDKINIEPQNTYAPYSRAVNLVKECNNYERLICALGGIDLAVLSIDKYGAFAPCNICGQFKNSAHLVTERYSQKRMFLIGTDAIMSAKRVLLILSGTDEYQAAQKALFGPITPAAPASILQLHNNVTVIYN